MRTFLAATTMGLALLGASPAFAAEQTVTLSISGMWCAGCAYMVKETLSDVEGFRRRGRSWHRGFGPSEGCDRDLRGHRDGCRDVAGGNVRRRLSLDGHRVADHERQAHGRGDHRSRRRSPLCGVHPRPRGSRLDDSWVLGLALGQRSPCWGLGRHLGRRPRLRIEASREPWTSRLGWRGRASGASRPRSNRRSQS